MHICATHEVTAINHVTTGTLHIFDIYHWTHMVVTMHIYVPLHCYCSALIDTTLVHKNIKHTAFDTYSYKVMDINVKEINMATKCKLTFAIFNK